MKAKSFLTIAAILALSSNVLADVSFTESFDGPALNPNLEVTNGFGGYSITGDIGNTTNTREYVRTVDGDYTDFLYEIDLTHTSFNSGGITFAGIGSGLPDPSFTNEPGNTLMFRFHNPGLIAGRVDLAFWHANGNFINDGLLNYNLFNAPMRIRFERVGDFVTAGFDAQFSGTYSADFQQVIDLNDAQFADLKAQLDSQTHLMFGGSSGTRFDNLTAQGSIVSVPEPGLTVLGLLAVGATIYRRKR